VRRKPGRVAPPIMLASVLALLTSANSAAQPNLLVGPSALEFAAPDAATPPAPQTVFVASSGDALSFQAKTGYWSNATGWLSVTPAAGATPSTLTLSVDTANLTTGVYLGYVEITSGTAKPTVLNVTLRVGGPAVPPPGTGASRLHSAFVLGRANHLNRGGEAHLVAEPRALAFRLAPGESTPSAQTITIGSTSQILNYTASSDSSSWLAVGPQLGSTSESNTVSVAVNLANLPAGTQTGFISVTAPGAAEALTIPVTVNTDAISPAAPGTNAALSVDKTSITLTGPLSGPPQTATIRITSTAAGQSFTAGVVPAFGFLSVFPNSGSTPATLTVTADPSVLSSAGQQSGTVLINSGTDTVFVQVIYNVTAGGGGGNAITATPSSVSFTQAQGGAAPSPQTVLLSSTTPTSFSATISNASWLTVTPISGTTNATLTLTASAGTLPVGTYQGSITIIGGASPVTVSVSLTVTSSSANAITAAPSSVSFTQAQGGATPSSQTVLLSSTTPTSFSAAISNASWLTVTPTSGTTNTTLTLTANAGTLTAGTYQGSITITGGASPVTVSVSLIVTSSSANAITAVPASVSFTQNVGGPAPIAQTALLSSTTPTVFTVTISNAAWLTVTPTSGTTNTTLTLTANAGTLTAGTYQGSITITGGASPVSIPVTLMVVGTGSTITANPPAIALPPLLLGQSGFSLGTIQLSALTPTSFVVSVPSSAPWLTVTPLTEMTPATLTLSASAVVPVVLAAGSYQTTLTVTGGATPVSIPVMLTVSVAPNSITASPAMASFSQVLGGAAPSAQTVQLSSPSPTNFTASATSTWLTVTPTSGTTPASLTLTVNPAGMAAGTYQDTITISGGSAPVTIPVSLTLSNDTFVPTPASLSFKQTVGTTTPSSQTVQLTSSAPRNYIASATTNWLSVSPAIGITPATLTITANATGLAVGSYMGSITVNGAGAPLSIPVTLTVATAAGAVFNPASLVFSFTTGGQTPAPQTVAVTSPASDFAFTATAIASNGGTWLSVSVSPPTSSTTPATLTVMVTPAGLAAGRYNGIITVTPTDTTIPVQNLPVTLTVNGGGSGSLVFVRSILNAASLLPGPIAPGEIITVTGLGLGPTVGAGPNLLASGAVDTLVAGTRLLFDGIPGPLLFVRADQINAIVPYTLNGRTGTNMQVEISGVRSDPIGLQVQSTAPALFSIDGSGRGQTAIVNQDGTINSAASPAARGDIIAIFGTGEGQTTPPGQDGRIVTTDLRTPIAPVSVKIGGVPAEVRYVGSAPGEVLGLFQLNVVVPAGLVSGPQLPVDILMGGVASQFGATMAVK
jgi:uncharacterized protein (TIGR03437 family)